MIVECLAALLVLVGGQVAWAQSGYNYVRPELAGGNAGAGLQGGALIPGGGVGVYPTGVSIMPATSAFGGFVGAGANTVSAGAGPGGGGGTSLYGPTSAGGALPQTGFGAQPQLTAGGSSGLLKRPTPAQVQPSRTTGGGFGQYSSNTNRLGNAPTTGVGLENNDYSQGDYSAIPGVPGVDYPVYAQVPRTNFDCRQQPLPGYYADIEAQCQVFHICALNRTYSFLCPNGTIFSQETLVCVWWNQYDCVSAPSLYANNAYIYDYEQRGGAGGGIATVTNVNANAGYQIGGSNAARGAAGVVPSGVYGSRSAVAAPSQGSGGFISSNTSRGYAPPPTAPGSAQFGGVIRSNIGPSSVLSGRGTSALLADTSGVAVGATPSAATNREYLPPATGRRP